MRRPRPKIMGILNVTPDSFSEGGRTATLAEAIAAGIRLAGEGAEIVDVGGESTRPGAAVVPVEEELRRAIPVVRALARAGVAVSIDTMKAEVMRAALDAGATMLNDVSALQADPHSMAVAAAAEVPVVLMHMPGNPRTMQSLAHYDDPVAEVLAALAARVEAAVEGGVSRSRIIIDPGIGFGKKLAHNLAILRALERFHSLGLPLLLGASRKALIAGVVGELPMESRLPGSLALALRGAEAGASYVRVHDVAATKQALAVWEAAAADVGEGLEWPGRS